MPRQADPGHKSLPDEQTRRGMMPRRVRESANQLLMSADQVFSISFTTLSGIGM